MKRSAALGGFPRWLVFISGVQDLATQLIPAKRGTQIRQEDSVQTCDKELGLHLVIFSKAFDHPAPQVLCLCGRVRHCS